MSKNTLSLSLKGVNELLMKYAQLDDDLKPITEKALKTASDTITKDVVIGVQKPNLPAGGKYSNGDTAESVIRNPQVKWQGNVAEVGLGFDYAKEGAGGFLIKGRYLPTQMNADAYLNMVFTGKGYMNRVRNDMEKTVSQGIAKRMGK